MTSLEPHDSCQIFFILPHQFIYLFIVLIFGLQSLSSLFSGRRFVEKNSPFDWTTFFILNVNLYLKGRGKPRGRERKQESIWFLWSMARSKSTKSTDILPFVIFLVCGVKCWGGSVDRTGYGPTQHMSSGDRKINTARSSSSIARRNILRFQSSCFSFKCGTSNK